MVEDGDCGSKIEKKDTEGISADRGPNWTQTRTNANASRPHVVHLDRQAVRSSRLDI
jgi:hypothetical protein